MRNPSLPIGIVKRLICLASLAAIPFSSLSCSLNAEFIDISNVRLSFESPSLNKFTNQTTYDFKIRFRSDNDEITVAKATMEIYEGEDCDPDAKVDERPLQTEGLSASSSGLENGKKYSARVFVRNDGKIYRSVCSPWVGVDLENPDPVTIQYPAGDTYVSSKQFLAAWTSSADHGISGLREEPYRLRLYGLPACAGPALQTVDSRVEQHTFENLTHGVTYSLQVSAVDNAGNESPLSCSPYTEVDVYAPGFRLEDPSSIEGYSRTTTPTIHIENDALAGYWCITPDLNFFPASHLDPCPGGAGTANGWNTTRPTTLSVPAGDGLKTYNLWIFRPNGTLLSNKETSAAIRLDQTPPGAFHVIGVGSSEDEVFDEWLTSLGQVRVKWQASADAVDYDLEIRGGDDAVICRQEKIPSGMTSFTFDLNECSPLLNAGTYEVRMTSFDIARNPTTTTFPFQVDLVPPEPFSILGIAGGNDLHLDLFFGSGSPTLHFEDAVGATHYEVEVRDTNDVTACTLASKAAPATLFDYAAEGGVSCLLLHGGTYRAFVTALDDGKSRTPASNAPFLFQVDTQAPSLAFDSGPASITTETSAEIAFHFEDPLSGMREVLCSSDGAPDAPCTSPMSFTGLSEGAHQLSVTAIDLAGNPVTESYSWFIDLTGPTSLISAGPSGAQPENSASFSFSATDVGPAGVQKYECSLNGAAFSDCVSPFSASSLSEGPQSFSVRAIDNLGNTGAAETRNFLTDYTAPSLAITSGPANPTDHDTSASISFAASDLGSGIASVRCRLNGGSFAPCTSPVSYSGLSAGPQTVQVQVTDHAGHVTTVSHSWTLYTYSWEIGAWGACSAAQPSWQAGSFGSCSAAQPAYTYGGWGGCSATCGGGLRYRSQSCPVVSGSQSRSVTCPVSSGLQHRSVTCVRHDGSAVADGKCTTSKPATSQACSRNDCAGAAPATTQACSRGGGSDCHSAQATSQSCNTQACCTGAMVGGYCWYLGGKGQSCDTVCSGRGGTNLAGTRDYAGSGGSNGACGSVLSALGGSSSVGGVSCNDGNEYTGCGILGDGWQLRCTGASTTGHHSFHNTRRACACGN